MKDDITKKQTAWIVGTIGFSICAFIGISILEDIFTNINFLYGYIAVLLVCIISSIIGWRMNK